MDYSELAKEFMQKMNLIHKGKQQKKMGDFLQGGAFILQYIYQRKEDVLPSEISNEMSISTARIAAALGSLESKGLITRQIDKNDRRQILVTLTPEGEEIAKKHQQDVMNDVSQMLQKLGERDAKEYVRIIGRLSEISNSNE
jgi:MarR family transcriptional regulator, organic hydroperoxide resistance regulator